MSIRPYVRPSVRPPDRPYFRFRTMALVNIKWIFTKLGMCIDCGQLPGFGLLIDKFL